MLHPRVAGPVLALITLLGAGLIPAAAYGVGVSAPTYRWTQVNKAKPNTSYWQTDRDVARVGRVDDGLFRSFFQIDTEAINGALVHGAEFDIAPDHSRPCVATQVDLWAARPIDPAKPLTWNNSKNYWLGDGPVATVTDNGCTGRLEFDGDALTKLAQQAADQRTGFVTVGLRAHDESAPGMAFRPADPDYATVMSIQYNNPPTVVGLNTVPARPCGTAAAPTPLTAGIASHFAARVADPDLGDNPVVRLEVLRADGSAAYTSEVGPVVAGSSFSWPDVSSGTFTDGVVYRYHAQARDNLDVGPTTADCYFTVDSVAPHTPTVSSTDYPDGEPVIMARTTGTVTLHVAGGDTDVAAFLWGMRQDTVTHRINVGPDGTATLPLTVIDDMGARLWARSVDRAGNLSPVTASWDLQVLSNPAPPAHVRGDLTGDGRPDVAMVVDDGRVWTFVAKDGGFYQGTVGYDPGTPAEGPYVRGDFDGDGRTDLAYARQNDIVRLASDGNGYGASVLGTAAKPDRMAAGDFTGDGKADLALQYPGQISVLANGVTTTWLSAEGAELVAGDFDGDGRADIATLNGITLAMYRSTGSSFDPTPSVVDARVDAASAVTGDVDGDGRDDVIALSDCGVTVFASATGFAPRRWSSFDAKGAVLGVGDFDLDGKADLAVIRGSGRTELWTLRPTGSAFENPVLGGREETGGTPLRVGE